MQNPIQLWLKEKFGLKQSRTYQSHGFTGNGLDSNKSEGILCLRTPARSLFKGPKNRNLPGIPQYLIPKVSR